MKYWAYFALVIIILTSSTVGAQTVPSSIPEYPSSIRVLFIRRDTAGNPDPLDAPYVVLSGPTAIPFESDYLPNVVHKEMTDSAYISAKEVQAITARGYAWHKQAYGQDPPNSFHDCFKARLCDVTDSTAHQAYYPGIATSSDFAAVQNTSKLFLAWSNQGAIGGTVAFTEYSKSHPGDYTVAFSDLNKRPYLDSVYDPIQGPFTGGHGRGMSQQGALRWERGNSQLDQMGIRYPFWNRDQILAHYYASVHLQHPNGTLYWGNYRWNALSIDRGTFINGSFSDIRVILQNTGTVNWEANTKLSVYWLRCFEGNCTPFEQSATVRRELVGHSIIKLGF